MIKYFIANTPLYFASFFKKISDKLYQLSCRLHIKFDTNVGKQLLKYEEYIKSLNTALTGTVKKELSDAKLANIIKGEINVTKT